MGRRLENWLSKAMSEGTRSQWKSRWLRFAKWVTITESPLTDKPYMECRADEVDDVIRRDFETMPSHIFQDKYKDIITKYIASLSHFKSNSALAKISSVRSFFTNEASSIKLQKGKVPAAEMAMGEHRFTLNDFRNMWLVADTEGKARLSTAVSLGWGVGDFLDLKTKFIRDALRRVDSDGFVAFDARRHKTKARVRGILTPNAVQGLRKYLERVSDDQEYLWTIRTKKGINYWLRALCKEAGLKENGSIRFHLIRKYVFDIVSSQCGVYEAKLLVGKRIPLSDATYLHGLQDRLLDRYKRFAYEFLNLNGHRIAQVNKIDTLTATIEDLQSEVGSWIAKAKRMEREIREIREARRESDEMMNRLFEDPKFITALKERMKELKI